MKECINCGKKCSGQRCSECFKKTRIFKVGELEFATKKELNNIIKMKIKESPKNEEFKDKFFSTIINNLHTDVIRMGFKVTKFKILDWEGQVGKWEFCRDRFNGGIFVIGLFEPINEWHGVTLYPHKRTNKVRNHLIASLRQKWREKAIKRLSTDRCHDCGGLYPQLHHDSESFKNIAEKSLLFFSEEELEKGIGKDWWLHEQDADAISNEHPAVIEMFRLHEGIKYRWVCHECHLKYNDY